jgi:phosphate transport system substrate-binding protein
LAAFAGQEHGIPTADRICNPGGMRTLAALLLVLALPGPARSGEELRLGGTGTALGTMRELAAAYMRAHPGSTVTVLPSIGSGGAIKAAAAGAIDVGLTGRRLEADERGLAVRELEYARTPLVFIAGPKVGIENLTTAELVRIYRGELERWPGGERVRLVMRPRVDVDHEHLRALSPEMAAALEAAFSREGMLSASTNQECNEIVARTPGAIGPSSLTQVITEPLPVKVLAWNGVAPTVENVARGKYPVTKPLYVIVRPAPSAAVRSFLVFLSSAEARSIIARTGNLPSRLAPLD